MINIKREGVFCPLSLRKGYMDQNNSSFREKVEAIVAQIPKGRVMTYGQIAALCGNARAARIVGGIAHFGDPSLPWHRVVNRKGGLAAGYPGGRNAHKKHLEMEGIRFNDDNFIQDFDNILWFPKML